MSDFILVYCSCPDELVAESLANTLVMEKLAACVSIQSGVRSVYVWKGELESAQETLLLIKTRQQLFERLSERITLLHPYEVPEIIAVPLTAGNTPYLQWLDQSLAGTQ